MIFRRSKYGTVIDAQIDLFVSEHRDVLDDVATRLERYNAAERDEAEELYGDYQLAIEAATDRLAELRDTYARTLDERDAEQYVREFNDAVVERWREFDDGTERDGVLVRSTGNGGEAWLPREKIGKVLVGR